MGQLANRADAARQEREVDEVYLPGRPSARVEVADLHLPVATSLSRSHR
jgi:hypothetical protein